ncbi:MAG TPA: EAL domain-containing protein [Usitatibacter sp.]|jgi:EAL domain-containing protein (putative c-di-GMP-specific phosphodiesterase class I)|nr:EAL domain-containing protein [Usitatibacter sp.]
MSIDLSDTGGLKIGAQIRDRLIRDLKDDKFVLYFQSIVPVAAAVPDNALYREILIRFKEEERDLMPPGTFLPILEQQGLMPLLDRWVAGQVARWVKAVHSAGTPRHAPRCSINVSSDTIRRDTAFADFVQQSVSRAEIPAGSLSFEIAISDVISAPQSVTRLVSSLRAAGCGVAFSGFAGEADVLELARSLTVGFVKIDGSLIYPVSRDRAAASRLQQLQQRCRSFGVQTICTQVEDPQTLEILRRIQVNYAQGFGIDRPRPLK